MNRTNLSAVDGLHLRLHRAWPRFTLDLNLQLPGRKVSALFGASGCGKTSTLRALAGLERETLGRVSLHGAVWQDSDSACFVPTHQRGVAYVFQEPSLFAHLSVQGNLDFGLRRVPAQQQRVSLERAVDMLGIAGLLRRQPDSLSGGERQRVAIARAVASNPCLLLLDEPLAALDAARKAEVLPYLEALQAELDIPMVYVSHASDEVARLADHLVLLDAGRVVASGPAADLLTRLDLSLAQGDAAAAIVRGAVQAHEAAFHLTHVQFSGGVLQLVTPPRLAARPIGQAVRLRIQARDVSLTKQRQDGTSILNVLPVHVREWRDDSTGYVMVTLDAQGTRLLARITQKSAATLALARDLPLFAQVKGVALLD